MISKDKLYSIQVLLKQEGGCTTPINLYCSECVLQGDICVQGNDWVDPYSKLKYIKELIKELSDDIIFDMLL